MPALSPPHPDTPTLSRDTTTALRRRLLAWYRKHKRDLPWRQEPVDPYGTLVSEAMLQQTQVATVVPYFHRFMAAFPTVQDLAASEEAEVLKLWEGLGYYRRARHLRKAAQVIVEEHGGQVPRGLEEILALPGVGRYTAGAIRSIGHGLPAPIVDGNVERVFARIFAIESDFGDAKSRLPLWSLAEQLVPNKHPGDFNQSLMELGATVCTPANPHCLLCPVAEQCEANRTGRQRELPIKKKRVKPKAVTHTVFVIERRGQYLVQQRPTTGLWAGMWEFPTAEEAATHDWLKAHTGLNAETNPPPGNKAFKHQTTHRTIRFEVLHCTQPTGRLKKTNPTLQWLTLAQIEKLPFSNPQKKVLAKLTP